MSEQLPWLLPEPRRRKRAMTRDGIPYSAEQQHADWRAYAVVNGVSGDWRRARHYGVSPEQLHALYLEQRACCYLCGDPLSKNLRLVAIDHDHACCPGAGGIRTNCGKCVRGIACNACNRLIGNGQDDPDRLRRIADNLEAANLRVRGGHGGANALRASPASSSDADVA